MIENNEVVKINIYNHTIYISPCEKIKIVIWRGESVLSFKEMLLDTEQEAENRDLRKEIY